MRLGVGLIGFLFPIVLSASTFLSSLEFEMRPVLRSLALELALKHPTGEELDELELSDEDVEYFSEMRLALVGHLDSLPTNPGLITFARSMVWFHAKRLARGAPEIPVHNDISDWAMEYLSKHGGGIELLNALRNDYANLRDVFAQGELHDLVGVRYELLIEDLYRKTIYEIPDYQVRGLSDSQITVVQQRIEAMAEEFLAEAEKAVKSTSTAVYCSRLLVANDNRPGAH